MKHIRVLVFILLIGIKSPINTANHNYSTWYNPWTWNWTGYIPTWQTVRSYIPYIGSGAIVGGALGGTGAYVLGKQEYVHRLTLMGAILGGLAAKELLKKEKDKDKEKENKVKIKNYDEAYEKTMHEAVKNDDEDGQRFWKERLEKHANMQESTEMREQEDKTNQLIDMVISVFETYYSVKYDPENPAPFFDFLYQIPNGKPNDFKLARQKLTTDIINDIINKININDFNIQQNNIELVKLEKVLAKINKYKHLVPIKKLETLQEYVFLLAYKYNPPSPYNLLSILYTSGNFIEFIIPKHKWVLWKNSNNGDQKIGNLAQYLSTIKN